VPAGARKEKKDAQVAAATENIEITCSLEAQKTADEEIFACENPHTKPGVYKYWIRVINGSTEIELDPFIMNM
jgi:hypothetical protein